jgi:hypothetical protein
MLEARVAESRIEATDRLRREGRWEAASKFREEKRREFKAAGLKRAEANDAAWDAMLAVFPPASTGTCTGEPTAVPDDAAIAALASRRPSPMSYADEVAWVYSHLGDEIVPTDEFPSLGAYSLWVWARSNPARFYDALWPKAESARRQQYQPLEDPAFVRAVINYEDVRNARLTEMASDLEEAMRGLAANALSILPDSLAQLARNRAESFRSAFSRLSVKYVRAALNSTSINASGELATPSARV